MTESFKFKRKNDGSIDVGGTMSELKTLLETYASQEKKENESIAKAVEAVFAEYPDEHLTLPAVATFAASKVGYTPDTFADTTEKIKNYVRSNAQYKVGKRAGVRRVA